jgi:hypothetical protein
MRLVLDHPRLADQAIMDLARWKDWTVMDRLVKLFTSADPETTTWVRIPVINYLRACPLPKAKEYIEELRKIDPKAVQQSETLYAVGPDPAPNVTTQRSDSAAVSNPAGNATLPANADGFASPAAVAPAAISPAAISPAAAASAPTTPATKAESSPAAPSNSSTGASDRMLPIAELIVAIGAVIGAVVLVAVNKSVRGKAAAPQTKE